MCSYLSDGQDVNKVFEALSPALTGAWPDIHTFGSCSPVDIAHVCAVRNGLSYVAIHRNPRSDFGRLKRLVAPTIRDELPLEGDAIRISKMDV